MFIHFFGISKNIKFNLGGTFNVALTTASFF